jgi:hypothetical protein
MALIDLKTDLKSLRYGKDTIGGGYSGQPYIQTPIPDSFNDLVPNEDFILRGGANAIGDAATDIKRLTKMFFDLKSPNGLLFIAKQNVLSQTAVRTQTTDGANEGIYSPLNTLAQAGVVELGGHLNKQGVNPFAETGAYANNIALYSVKVKPTQPIEDNRLARLHQLVSINAGDKLDGFILNNGPANVLTYSGGPGSILGVGTTNIRYSSFRTGNQNPYFSTDPNFFKGNNNQRSVNAEDKQVGGLQIDPNKSWTKSPDYILPTNNVNTPQSSSLSAIPYGPKTYTPQYDLPALGYSNNGFVENKAYIYNVLDNSPITALGGLYDEEGLGLNENYEQYWSVDGKRLQQTSVYQPGSLKPYVPVVDSQKTQKTVNDDNKSVGGLKVNWLKPWTKSNTYHVPYSPNKIASIGLPGGGTYPGTNVNTPQSQSLSNIPNGPSTWRAKQNVTNPNGNNYSTQINDRTGNTYNKGVTNTWHVLTKIAKNANSFSIGNKFKPNWDSNVYTQGNTFPENSPVIYSNNTFTYTQEDLYKEVNDNPNKLSGSPKIQDFRKILRASLRENQRQTSDKTGATPTTPDYNDGNIGVKNLIGNPGSSEGKSLVSYTKGSGIGPVDQINATGIGESIPDNKRDLVTFNISNFGGGNTLHFRAFLGSFSDSYSSKINAQQYVGRGEDFYTYNGFTRKISLSWTVAALSKEELIPMYKKLSYLASNTAPVYNDGFMQGPLIQLTVGGYIHNMPGYIEGLTLEMGEESTWEIGINDTGGRDETVAQLTHIVKVSGFNFVPIPKYLPERGAHFIDLWNGSSNLW